MAKVDHNTIQNALNEANEIEYELSFDKECRDLDSDYQDDWRSELEPEPIEDWYLQDDHFDNSHWGDSCIYEDPYHDYDNGDY